MLSVIKKNPDFAIRIFNKFDYHKDNSLSLYINQIRCNPVKIHQNVPQNASLSLSLFGGNHPNRSCYR